MKKSYAESNRTICSGYGFDNPEEKIEYKKIKENLELAVGSRVVGILGIKGKYGESYSLACIKEGDKFFLNIPSWLGTKIMDDLIDEKYDVDVFFKDVYITSIDPLDTGKGNSTWNIIF